MTRPQAGDLEGNPSRARRVGLATALRRRQDELASSLTDGWYTAHPESLERWGPGGRMRTAEDFRYHLAFLATAIEFGSVHGFDEYVRWTAGVLEARGISRTMLSEALGQMHAALASRCGSDDATLLGSFIASGLATLADESWRSAQTAADDRPHRVFLQALLAGERRAATTVARQWLSAGRSVEDGYLQLIQRALYEVGQLWASNEITVADEHLATAVAQFVLAQLYAELPRSTAHRGNMIITGVEGEHHQVGAHIVADLLEADGWDVKFLGANVPTSAVIDQVTARHVDVVGVSATLLVSLPAVSDFVERLALACNPRPFVIVGGAAFAKAPDAWREVGADAMAADGMAARLILRETRLAT